MTAKFSVAMCTYNGERYIRDQLASIAAQTQPPDELIVCDDHSQDETVRLIEQFSDTVNFRVRLVINDRNLGSTKNFEQAIRLCNGDLIALSDQDDVWLPAKLQRMKAEFDRSPNVGLVCTDLEVVDESLNPLGYTIWQNGGFGRQEQEMARRGAAFTMLLKQNFVTGAAMAFRAGFTQLALPVCETVIKRYGTPDWHVIHDAWIALIVAAAADVVMIADPLIKYRRHPYQQVGTADRSVRAARQRSSWITRLRQEYDEFFLSEIRLLTMVRERLLSAGSDFECHVALAELEERIAHLTARLNVGGEQSERVRTVFRELLSRRYFRYSNGVSSAARDLLLR